jgi:release factor glutamine methyltransferase
MELREALQKGISILREASVEAAAAEAGILLCHVAGCDRTHLYAHGEESLCEGISEQYLELLNRRAKGIPIQYILGFCEFMSLGFKVNPGVLIPRQDTEILVESVIDFCKECSGHLKILDLCTGSGCIAVSLAHYVKDCAITATDISETAIRTAYENALKNGVADKIEFIRGSLFEVLNYRKFDIIVSNPPYIRRTDIAGLQREVRDFEPWEALDGGQDGLSFYRDIVGKAREYLEPLGFLALEVGIGQAQVVKELMERDFSDITKVKDLSGIDRVMIGKLKDCIQNSLTTC